MPADVEATAEEAPGSNALLDDGRAKTAAAGVSADLVPAIGAGVLAETIATEVVVSLSLFTRRKTSRAVDPGI